MNIITSPLSCSMNSHTLLYFSQCNELVKYLIEQIKTINNLGESFLKMRKNITNDKVKLTSKHNMFKHRQFIYMYICKFKKHKCFT